MSNAKGILLLSHLRIQNANAISGPLTWGFPAPSAFTGFVHALSCHIPKQYSIRFDGVGIICHQFNPQVAGKYAKVFNLARHPVDKEGKTAALVEEGRVHLEVSLVIEAHGCLEEHEYQHFAESMLEQVYTMRIAGGSILPAHANVKLPAQWKELTGPEVDLQKEFKKIRRCLLPGFALVSRQDLLESRFNELKENAEDTTPLDALLDLTQLNIDQNVDPLNTEQATWEYRHKSGWLVPIPVGYGAISDLYSPGAVANSRDEETAVRFVESLYSLGQWISPHRIENFAHLFWRHDARPDENLYLCTNAFKSKEITI